MDYAGADLQGAIGYMFARAFRNEFKKRGIERKPVAVVTETLVDLADPAFQDPSKPIGSHMDEGRAKKLAAEHGWVVKEDAGRGWRRVVPSPRPRRIVDLDVIAFLARAGYLVIGCGGGGIPVVEDEGGNLRGVEAVIDKDLAASLLARQTGADLLLVSTGVEKVALDFNTPRRRWLDRLSLSEAKRYHAEEQFDRGSMGPKIEAAIEFLEAGGQRCIITDPRAVRSRQHGTEDRGGHRISRGRRAALHHHRPGEYRECARRQDGYPRGAGLRARRAQPCPGHSRDSAACSSPRPSRSIRRWAASTAAEVVPVSGRIRCRGGALALDEVAWEVPVAGAVYGTLLNYKGAVAALGEAMLAAPYQAPPVAPVLYLKPANTWIGCGGAIPLAPEIDAVEIGAALAVVFGRSARRVRAEEALDYVLGFTIVNDVSVPHASLFRPAVRQRCRDGFCPIGPWIVDKCCLARPGDLSIRIRINGELRLENSTANLVRGIGRLIADVSAFMTLRAGDLLHVGTPEKAPLARAGDRVSIEIEGIGRLENRLVAEGDAAPGGGG